MSDIRTKNEKVLIEALETILDCHVFNLFWISEKIDKEAMSFIDMIGKSAQKALDEVGYVRH